VLGLYPLTALPVDFGIDRFQQETRALFAQPLAALPVRGELRRFGPDTASPVPVNLTDIPRDALGIPEPTPAQLEALFAAHAPLWEIDVATDADRPGAPYWRADGLPTVNPAERQLIPPNRRFIAMSLTPAGGAIRCCNSTTSSGSPPGHESARSICWVGRWMAFYGG